MTGKILLLFALVWFGAVLLWSRFRGSFFLGLGHGKIAKAAAYSLAYLIQILIFGWIVPLAIGVYRLIKHH